MLLDGLLSLLYFVFIIGPITLIGVVPLIFLINLFFPSIIDKVSSIISKRTTDKSGHESLIKFYTAYSICGAIIALFIITILSYIDYRECLKYEVAKNGKYVINDFVNIQGKYMILDLMHLNKNASYEYLQSKSFEYIESNLVQSYSDLNDIRRDIFNKQTLIGNIYYEQLFLDLRSNRGMDLSKLLSKIINDYKEKHKLHCEESLNIGKKILEL